MAGMFCHTYRVTYADCTVGNHIYYSRYLDLLEAARGEFFRSLGCTFLQWQEQGVIFPVIEARLGYKAPARYDDVLKIAVGVTTAARARLNFSYVVTDHAGRLILEAETCHVCAGLNDKPRRLPEGLVAALKPFLRSDAVEGIAQHT